MVLDYFDFVRASQRRDGDIPFASFNGNTRPGSCPPTPSEAPIARPYRQDFNIDPLYSWRGRDADET